MIHIELIAGSGEFYGFSVWGHAEFANAGEDIVCAAVSALTQSALIGLMDVAGVKVKYSIDDGDMKCEIPREMDSLRRVKADAIVGTMLAGLKAIAEQYPGYLDIKVKRDKKRLADEKVGGVNNA